MLLADASPMNKAILSDSPAPRHLRGVAARARRADPQVRVVDLYSSAASLTFFRTRGAA
jgi:hypothetical protein